MLAAAAHAAPAPCAAAVVHYGSDPSAPGGVTGPWVESSGAAFRGYLFYLGGTRWARTRPRRAHLFTVRARTRIAPKVLWAGPPGAGLSLTLVGSRLDGAGTFRATFPVAGGAAQPQYPSYVRIPAAGCWRLTLRSGVFRGTVTFLASDRI